MDPKLNTSTLGLNFGKTNDLRHDLPVDQIIPAQVQAPAPEKSNLEKAIVWLGKQILSVREWAGRDGRLYGSAVLSTVPPPSTEYKSGQALAQGILAGLANSNNYVTFGLNYNGKKAIGRMLKIDANGEMILALQVAYTPGNVTASMTSLTPRVATAPAEGSAIVSDDAFGPL